MAYTFMILLVSFVVGCSSKPTAAPAPKIVAAQAKPVASEAKPAATAVAEPAPTPTTSAQESADGTAGLTEWFGECRKVVNEAGKVVEGQDQLRLQTSYKFRAKTVWMIVRNFADAKCDNALEENRFRYDCDSDPSRKIAKCKTVKRELASSGEKPKEMPLVDTKGTSSVSEVRYSVRFLKGKKAVLRIIDESDEESNVTLFAK